MAKPATPPKTNGYDKATIEDVIVRVENVEEEIASTMSAAMRQCKTLRGDIKTIYVDAKDAGLPAKAIKVEVKLRRLDKRKADILAGLDEEEDDSFDVIHEALGDFASSPLGEAVLAAAHKRASARA